MFLLISPTPTHPTNAGNRARIRKWLELCVEAEVDFHFVFFRQEPGDEGAMVTAWGADRCTFLDYQLPPRSYGLLQRLCSRIARKLGGLPVVPYKIDDWRYEPLVEDVAKLAKRLKPNCVLVEYVFYSHLFECFDRSVFKILDTHDIVAGREQMFIKQGREPEWFYTTRRQEKIGVNRADHVVAIQEQESGYFKSLTRKPVTTVGHLVNLKSPTPPLTATPTVVFMGSGNKVNQDGLNFLLGQVWPLVFESLPDACLEVFGAVCNAVTTELKGVRLAGVIDDASQAYERAWLIICPLRFGTGLKIKSIEALGQGKALVATTSGSTGIESGRGNAFLWGDSPREIAENCVRVLTHEQTRNDFERKAYEFAANWNLIQKNAFDEVIRAAGVK